VIPQRACIIVRFSFSLRQAIPHFDSDQEWKHSCYVHCLAPVLEVQNRPLDYSIVIDLDKKIRDFSIPPPFRSGVAQSRSLIMQRASLSTALEAGS